MPHPAVARLYVLGSLRNGPRHGYAVRQEAEQEKVEAWTDLKSGSIYHALGTLEASGLVVVDGVEREGARPQKTVYRLSDAGREELRRLLEDTIRSVRLPADAVDVAMRLLDDVAPAEAQSLIGERAHALRTRVAQLESAFDDAAPYLAPAERMAFRHTIARWCFEADWFSDPRRLAELQGGD